jgi:hypothetical protein
MLFAMYIKREIGVEKAQAMMDAKSIPIQSAHAHLGHPHEDMTREMATELNWTLSRGSIHLSKTTWLNLGSQSCQIEDAQ